VIVCQVDDFHLLHKILKKLKQSKTFETEI